jgi:hypothetical protein
MSDLLKQQFSKAITLFCMASILPLKAPRAITGFASEEIPVRH